MYHVSAQGVDERISDKCTLSLLLCFQISVQNGLNLFVFG